MARVYELFGTDRPVALAPLLGYKSSNAIRNLQKGKYPPGELVLLRIKLEKGEDLRGLLRASGGDCEERPSGDPGTERGMQNSEVNPEIAELLDGVREILDSGVEAITAALRANILAFRLSAKVLRRKPGPVGDKRGAAQEQRG